MAILFDGTTSTGLLTNPAFLPPNTNPLTVCFFAKINVSQGKATSFFSYQCAAGVYDIETGADGVTLQFTEASIASVVAGPLTVGVWYFIALVISESENAYLYWKSVGDPTCQSVTVAAQDPGKLSQICVANDALGGGGNAYLNGMMAGIRIWRRAISQAELEMESTVIFPISRAALLYAWALETFNPANPDVINNAGTKAALAGNDLNLTTVTNPPILRIKPIRA